MLRGLELFKTLGTALGHSRRSAGGPVPFCGLLFVARDPTPGHHPALLPAVGSPSSPLNSSGRFHLFHVKDTGGWTSHEPFTVSPRPFQANSKPFQEKGCVSFSVSYTRSWVPRRMLPGRWLSLGSSCFFWITMTSRILLHRAIFLILSLVFSENDPVVPQLVGTILRTVRLPEVS